MKRAAVSEKRTEAERGLFGRKYTPAEITYLRAHAIVLSRGKLDGSGNFTSDPDSLKSLFEARLPEALKEAKRNGHPLRVMFWAHGGLVSEADALDHVISHGKIWEASGIYPIYFVWKTGILESFRSIMQGQRTSRGFITDPLVEAAFRVPASAVWSEIKSFASLSSQPSGGATLAAASFAKFYQTHADSVVCYACGHSAGSIFHGHWLPLLAAADVPVKELFLLAPAMTVDMFSSALQGLVGRGKSIGHCSLFTMFDKSELRDHVIQIYRKSLLYFVSRACEPMFEEPILGLEKCLRADAGMHAFWGLDPQGRAVGETVFSPSGSPLGIRASNATSHGGFDNDPSTLNSLVRRMTGNLKLTPFDLRNSRALSAPGGGARAVASARSKENLKLDVEIQLRLGSIEQPLAALPKDAAKIDFRVAGHYDGVEPASAEYHLDRWASGIVDRNDRSEGIVAGMVRRGTMVGALGQTFIVAKENSGAAVFLGLGKYGSLGPAELATAVRELCLQISQLKGRHIATVMIGSGNGNMSVSSAMDAWLRGISHAGKTPGFTIERVTFVEYDPKRFLEAEAVMARSLSFYQCKEPPCSPQEFKKACDGAAETCFRKAAEDIDNFVKARNRRIAGKPIERIQLTENSAHLTSRITIRAEKEYYCFTALTDMAAVPERIVRIDSRFIDEISREIAAASDAEKLANWGRTLQKMIIPRDLHSRLFNSAAHVVMTLDATTARIPWEMMIIPKTPLGMDDQFMSLAEGFGVTRQLQTGFAPVPERQRAADQKLSILIISDPAADAPLPGAAREGEEVESYFDRLENPDIRITHLTGPDATRANLSNELCNGSFDILHFAGHCYFNKDTPGKSGWIFNGDPLEVFSADELLRIDRVPQFIFSNACESGITPDRAHEQNPGIGPVFAEAFLAQGVSNIICTGWPVDDLAALEFTRKFYERFHGEGDMIKDAMFLARQAAAEINLNTAGAYQHYGNPFYQLTRAARTP